jgi:hypothetical protein
MSRAVEDRSTPDPRLAALLLQAAAQASQGERARVRIGRRQVAVVPVENLLLLERLEDEEDLRDVRASRAETKRKGTIPWDQVKASLGLERSARRIHRGNDAEEGTAAKEEECGPSTPPVRGRPVRVDKGGRVVGFLISNEDFAFFRRLLDAEEDRLDIAATRKALREVESVSLEELENELGL